MKKVIYLVIILLTAAVVVYPQGKVPLKAEKIGRQVLLTWHMNDLSEVARFEIERGANTWAFDKTLALLDRSYFNYTDVAPTALSCYRLRIVYMDGHCEYSDTASVQFDAEQKAVLSIGTFQIDAGNIDPTKPFEAVLRDASGRVVPVLLPTSDRLSGVYVLYLRQGSVEEVRKILL